MLYNATKIASGQKGKKQGKENNTNNGQSENGMFENICHEDSNTTGSFIQERESVCELSESFV